MYVQTCILFKLLNFVTRGNYLQGWFYLDFQIWYFDLSFKIFTLNFKFCPFSPVIHLPLFFHLHLKNIFTAMSRQLHWCHLPSLAMMSSDPITFGKMTFWSEATNYGILFNILDFHMLFWWGVSVRFWAWGSWSYCAKWGR